MVEFAIPAEVDTLELSEKGVAFPILSLTTGEPLVIDGEKMTITLKGSDSDAYQKAQIEVERKRGKVLAAGGDFNSTEALAELLASVTTAWTGFKDAAGVAAQCTLANAKALYQQVPVIRDQVHGRVTYRANFTKASLPA